jgi:fatty acid/phospholipid biosynthesis enzyme
VGVGKGRGTREREREREKDSKKGHREKGISVCMALKLINRDETASVIKTGNVGAYVTSYFIQLRVCVCVYVCGTRISK